MDVIYGKYHKVAHSAVVLGYQMDQKQMNHHRLQMAGNSSLLTQGGVGCGDTEIPSMFAAHAKLKLAQIHLFILQPFGAHVINK